MATAEGMEGVSTTQVMDKEGQGVKQEFLGAFWAQTKKMLASPELWAGAVAGFVAGTAVGFAANQLWKGVKNYLKR